MSKAVIASRLQEFVYHEIKMVREYHYNAHEAVTRCYGAIMFVLNLDDNFDEELNNWWDNEILPIFREFERGQA